MDNEVLELLRTLHADMDGIKSTLDEHTQILRALEERTSVINAKLGNMEHDVAEINGRLTRIENDVKIIKDDVLDLEKRTAKNWYEIANMKQTYNR